MKYCPTETHKCIGAFYSYYSINTEISVRTQTGIGHCLSQVSRHVRALVRTHDVFVSRCLCTTGSPDLDGNDVFRFDAICFTICLFISPDLDGYVCLFGHRPPQMKNVSRCYVSRYVSRYSRYV